MGSFSSHRADLPYMAVAPKLADQAGIGLPAIVVGKRYIRFQESCHPSDLNTRALEDMTNASLQQGR